MQGKNTFYLWKENILANKKKGKNIMGKKFLLTKLIDTNFNYINNNENLNFLSALTSATSFVEGSNFELNLIPFELNDLTLNPVSTDELNAVCGKIHHFSRKSQIKEKLMLP